MRTPTRYLWITLAVLLPSGEARAQNCPASLPPSDFCSAAYVLPGTPGLHEAVMNVYSATAVGETVCGVAVGHTVWFSVTPTVNGTLTFSTCHPLTTYDTVAQAYRGGESTCEFMTSIECNDDTIQSECSNACGPYRGSRLMFEVTSGTQYRFQVGSYNNNSANCNLCLGVYVSICDESDAAPPVTEITSPTPMSCVCGVVSVVGSAYGTPGDLRRYRLEYASASGGPWSLIASGSTDVINGVLGYWDTNSLPLQGYYFLRLTAEDVCGNVSPALLAVWVDKNLDEVRLDAPSAGMIVGGMLCADGTVWDHCAAVSLLLEYRPIGGIYAPFDTLSGPWVINNPLGSWNTAARPDGIYEIRLLGQDECSHLGADYRTVTVDNTPPIAVITSPSACTNVLGMVQVIGTAQDANLLGWQLAFSGGTSTSWVTISSGSLPVTGSLLGTWNTAGLPRCSYALRLVVTDASVINCNGAVHNQSEYIVVVEAGLPCDLNGDGHGNALDVQPFVNCLLSSP